MTLPRRSVNSVSPPETRYEYYLAAWLGRGLCRFLGCLFFSSKPRPLTRRLGFGHAI